MTVAVALFTQDLRLHDNPVLHAARHAADQVVPLFVLDPDVAAVGFAAPNRQAFLAACLADLDASLRRIGSRLVLRHGDPAEQAARIAAEADADTVHVAAGVSAFARRRETRLRRLLGRRLHVHEAVLTVVPPGRVTPAGRDHYAVFTPYHRAWQQAPRRSPHGAPRRLDTPDGIGSAELPAARPHSPGLPPGGESAARQQWRRWDVDGYADLHDALAADGTSRLSPYLHFGCLSAGELAARARAHGGDGAEAFVRQLAWRDFHHQLLAARPEAAHRDYRPRDGGWHRDEREADAWREGRTGYPIVDAGMRQLEHEGWMHNRARLLTASFLTKTLHHDWRVGAAHFLRLLVDGDLANNQLNWQWVAGTGTDTRPNRVLNPLRQADRYDPDGAYVRRWVPELAHLPGPSIHRPWLLAPDYPAPLVAPEDLALRLRTARALD
ncbi:cryptochrome/photolyase family protein [Kitasatospora cheerisanensis]|uniref:Deoxyribodipyrimidine photo-lyase n=1 Tax=Kitasatospora cheerisanensis KCTC 2395 TaxID=1348663 RepID=A0A066Z1V8_9ACTN|nr:deoxyribodipyrimidine photo-lyase [Kitasatospora cheerisanensis]KDN87748.1 deoxyribodipyrimidine photo-lyase [Kitasatospora cheerisanensis KCTC 2395]